MGMEPVAREAIEELCDLIEEILVPDHQCSLPDWLWQRSRETADKYKQILEWEAIKPASQPAQEEVLTLEGARQLLKCSDETLRGLVLNSQLPCRLVGGSFRFSRAAILHWLQCREEG